MYIKPEIAFYLNGGETPIYKCKCGKRFTRMDLLNNKLSKGTRNYCPSCKNKLHFE